MLSCIDWTKHELFDEQAIKNTVIKSNLETPNKYPYIGCGWVKRGRYIYIRGNCRVVKNINKKKIADKCYKK